MSQSPQSPPPSPPGSYDVVVYTRAGCHLCDDAEAMLRAEGLRPRLVDIDADPQLRVLHNEWVPVVEIAGRVRFRGKIDPLLLRRIVRQELSPSD